MRLLKRLGKIGEARGHIFHSFHSCLSNIVSASVEIRVLCLAVSSRVKMHFAALWYLLVKDAATAGGGSDNTLSEGDKVQILMNLLHLIEP